MGGYRRWCLLFLLPWPSPGRAWLEFRGYRMSLAMKYWIGICNSSKKEKTSCTFFENYDITWVVNQFTGPAYYFMFPVKSFIEKKLRATMEDIKNDKLTPELLKMKNKVFNDSEFK